MFNNISVTIAEKLVHKFKIFLIKFNKRTVKRLIYRILKNCNLNKIH